MNKNHRFTRLIETARRVFLLVLIIVGLYTLGNTAVQTYNETNVPQVQRGLLTIWV